MEAIAFVGSVKYKKYQARNLWSLGKSMGKLSPDDAFESVCFKFRYINSTIENST